MKYIVITSVPAGPDSSTPEGVSHVPTAAWGPFEDRAAAERYRSVLSSNKNPTIVPLVGAVTGV